MKSTGEPSRSILERGSQDVIKQFLQGRELLSQLSPIELLKEKHDEKYQREVAYDARDTAKGKPCFKKYRQDRVNQHSNCDAQYVNNLHFYFGDGSQLYKAPKPHYALDLVNTRGTETECTAALKSVEVTSKKVTNEWLEEAARHLKLSSRLRRSFSCPRMKLSDNEQEKPMEIYTGSYKMNCSPLVTVFGLENDFPVEIGSDASEFHRGIAHSIKVVVQRTNAPTIDPLNFAISKVLFWTDELNAYVIPETHNVSREMKQFSEIFENWLAKQDDNFKKHFGTHEKYEQYWKYVNVVLCLPESESDGVKFRRARHIHRSQTNQDLYLELDSGKFRVVESNPDTVRRLPQVWARFPIGIVQVSFQGVTTIKQMKKQVEIMKRTGRAFVTKLRECNRRKFQEKIGWNLNHSLQSIPPWSNLWSVLLCPLQEYESPSLTRVFCEDRDCMGLCGTHLKSPPSCSKMTTF